MTTGPVTDCFRCCILGLAGDIVCGNVDTGRFPTRRIRTCPTAGLWREEDGEEEKDDSPPPRKDWVHYVQCALRGEEARVGKGSRPTSQGTASHT